MNMYIWATGILNQLFKEILKLKLNFQKNEAVGGKRPFFVMGPFRTPHSICLNILFWFIVLWIKKLSSSFFKQVLVFQKTFFKVNILSTFKIPCDCHIKPCLSLKWRAFLKIPRIDFHRSTRSFYWLQNKTSARKRFSVLRQKPPTFCRKTCLLQRSSHDFSIY